VRDVRPLPAGDTSGLALFFFLIVCTLGGFLSGYRGLTHEAYTLDLRQFTTWCRAHSLPLFAVRRADIESFARDLEARGRARATVTRRLCTIAGFYKSAVEEELIVVRVVLRLYHVRAR
jgi:site-specific recombinase XerD